MGALVATTVHVSGPIHLTGPPAESPWYAVAAGLGAAVILALASFYVAHRQRSAEADRFDEQLAHDRDQRRKDLDAAADRLERQLRHDRELRDREHLRRALEELMSQALDLDPVTDLELVIEAHAAEWGQLAPADRLAILNALQAVAEQSQKLTQARARMPVLLGAGHDISRAAHSIAQVLNSFSEPFAQWREGKITKAELDSRMAELDDEHTEALSRLAEAAHAVVGVAGSASD